MQRVRSRSELRDEGVGRGDEPVRRARTGAAAAPAAAGCGTKPRCACARRAVRTRQSPGSTRRAAS